MYPREALLGGRHDHHDHVIAIYEAPKKLNCDKFWIWEKLILEGGRRSRPRLRLWPARLPGDNPHAHSSAATDVFPRRIRVFVSVQNVNFLVLRLYVIVYLYLSNACIVFIFMLQIYFLVWFYSYIPFMIPWCISIGRMKLVIVMKKSLPRIAGPPLLQDIYVHSYHTC